MLDEPTNHLDFGMLNWLEGFLCDRKGSLLVVSHDRYFLNRCCNAIWEIEGKALEKYPGSYEKYVQIKKERLLRKEKEYEAQKETIEKLQDFVDKNITRASTSNRAKSRQKLLDRMEPLAKPKKNLKPPQIMFKAGAASGKSVAEIQALAVAVGEGESRRVICQGLSLSLKRGTKLAIIGENGAGKTSFFRTLINELPAVGGRITWGVNVRKGYFSQGDSQLSDGRTPYGEMREAFPFKTEFELKSTLARVGLTGDMMNQRNESLSGGEKARLKFALLMQGSANLLLMDEPTNHMDIPSKEALDEALKAYDGTLLLISHDRYLLSHVPQEIAVLGENGFNFYSGGYNEYLETMEKEVKNPLRNSEASLAEETEGTAVLRGKKKRSVMAEINKRRLEYENAIASLEKEIAELKKLMETPEGASDYQLLQEACARLEEAEGELEREMEGWAQVMEEEERLQDHGKSTYFESKSII
jgi:ATP-binding cassette subfamily F protein 3